MPRGCNCTARREFGIFQTELHNQVQILDRTKCPSRYQKRQSWQEYEDWAGPRTRGGTKNATGRKKDMNEITNNKLHF